jgi:hypothetical protein
MWLISCFLLSPVFKHFIHSVTLVTLSPLRLYSIYFCDKCSIIISLSQQREWNKRTNKLYKNKLYSTSHPIRSLKVSILLVSQRNFNLPCLVATLDSCDHHMSVDWRSFFELVALQSAVCVTSIKLFWTVQRVLSAYWWTVSYFRMQSYEAVKKRSKYSFLTLLYHTSKDYRLVYAKLGLLRWNRLSYVYNRAGGTSNIGRML